MFTKKDVVNAILKNSDLNLKEMGSAFAPSNIALCKYWGKRDKELNLPVNSSLSISLGELGSATEIKLSENHFDEIFLNNERVDPESLFYRRAIDFINLIRPSNDLNLKILTFNSIPTAAGLASSASGFAALTMALNDFFGFNLSKEDMSVLARMGSGSACRSIYNGFVKWNKGSNENGLDSYAEFIPVLWSALRIGIVEVTAESKKVGSRNGMNQTVETSRLYKSWPKQAADDLDKIEHAIREKDFQLLGKTAEQNACSMHATMLSGFPPLIYWLPETVAAIHKIHQLRAEGLPLYFTIDAGPNVKILFEEQNTNVVKEQFPKLKIVKPFGS